MTFNSMSRVFGIAGRFCCSCCFVLLLNSAIVSHHLLGQSGSFFKRGGPSSLLKGTCHQSEVKRQAIDFLYPHKSKAHICLRET